MNYKPAARSHIKTMVYSPNWHRTSLSLSQHVLPDDCLFLVPESQAELSKQIHADFLQCQLQVLNQDSQQGIVKKLERSEIKRLCFVTKTPWDKGVIDADILSFFRLIKALIEVPKVQLDIITVRSITCPAYDGVTHPVDGVYIGLAQTLAKEFEQWQIGIFSLVTLNKESVLGALNGNFKDLLPGSPVIIAQDQYWYSTMDSEALAPSQNTQGFKQGGCYLVIGANGGIGQMLAKYLAKTYRAKLVLVGRSASNSNAIGELQQLGAEQVSYEQLDLTDGQAVNAVFERHPDINGVIHSALVLEDATIATMSEQTLMDVLQPKVHGTVSLINAIRGKLLDFVLFFSSIQSYIANVGQANYSAACVAKDAMADMLDNILMTNAKVVNWGYWGNIGIVASDVYRERMKRLQVGSIEADEGLAVIEALLNSDTRQVTVSKASDLALQRLNITPHRDNQSWFEANKDHVPTNFEDEQIQDPRDNSMAYNDSNNDTHEVAKSLLAKIVPHYDNTTPAVKYNENASRALDEYSCSSLHKIQLPAVIDPKFALLEAAIKVIPNGNMSRETLIRDYPEIKGHVQLLDKCLASYPDILSGQKDPLEVMFPSGSFELVAPVYNSNPIADYFNKMVAQIADNYICQAGGRPIKIIEIGSGTGSTTKFVVPKIAGHVQKYVFSDLSFAFLNKARTQYSQYDFMDYQIFDISNPPKMDETFDIVVATNVIHATADLDRTVSNVRNLLNEGGIFILNEITSVQNYATLTFGLTEGWWLSVDEYRIANSPLLSGSTWHRLMKKCDFGHVVSHGSEDQQVIVGYAGKGPGVNSLTAPSKLSSVNVTDSTEAVAQGNEIDSEKVEHYIKQNICQIMHMEISDIHSSVPFNEYGIDSLIAMELLKPFKDELGYIPATVLFEYPTVGALAGHFIDLFGDKLRARFGQAVVVESPAEQLTPPKPVAPMQAVQPPQAIEPPVSAAATSEDRRDQIEAIVKKAIAETMLMEVNEIKGAVPFMEYGIDSIISLELLKPLKAEFGYLPSTLLFECPSVDQLTAYLDEHHGDSIAPVVQAPTLVAPVAPVAASTAKSAQSSEVVGEPLDAKGPRPSDMAIIGISGQLPQAKELTQFWQNLVAGQDSFSDIPAERWVMDGFVNPDAPMGGGSYTTKGAFIDDIDAFDNGFFNLTPLDAQRMDPQERLFLQNVYQVMLDAGYTMKTLKGTDTGVYVGVMNSGYDWHLPKQEDEPKPTSLFWSMANRASYFYDLRGPSMAVDTACSASLTALHTASQAVRNGDCRQAIVGGVNLIVHPRQYELLCGMHMLSKSGVCKPFGQGADGFVDGEGVVAVMIKQLSDAQSDGDRIYGVLRATAVNAGGRSNGYSAPNPEAQAALIKKAISRAGISASDIAYVEAHGTGTELGDPIEIRGLCAAFDDVAKQSVAVGSVKSNIGHLESAAGMSGLLKVLLQMRHNTLVASLHCESENAHLQMSQTPFYINRQNRPWPSDKPRIASICSYGAGGGNAHAIVEHFDQPVLSALSGGYYVITLSHQSKAGLQRHIDLLRGVLEKQQPDLARLAYTLNCRRDHFTYRAAFAVDSIAALKQALKTSIESFNQPPKALDIAAILSSNAPDSALSEHDAQQLANAYCLGNDIHWDQLKSACPACDLFGYSFEQSRFWVDSKDSNFKDINSIVQSHVMWGTQMAPAAWVISELTADGRKCSFESIVWREAIYDLKDVVRQDEAGQFRFYNQSHSKVYCQGTTANAVAPETFSRVIEKPQWIEKADIYNHFNSKGYEYGQAMQALQWAQVGEGVVKGCLSVSKDWGYALSPALLDGGLQTAILIPQLAQGCAEGEVFVPYHIDQIALHKVPTNEAVYVYCIYNEAMSFNRSVNLDFYFTDENNQVLISLKGVTSVVIDNKTLIQASKQKSDGANVTVYDLNT